MKVKPDSKKSKSKTLSYSLISKKSVQETSTVTNRLCAVFLPIPKSLLSKRSAMSRRPMSRSAACSAAPADSPSYAFAHVFKTSQASSSVNGASINLNTFSSPIFSFTARLIHCSRLEIDVPIFESSLSLSESRRELNENEKNKY